jgi:hypothetical protein
MNKKIIEFIKRNKKRNQHLYLPKTVAGYDYVVCPISGERLSMIKDNYIIKILGILVEEYPLVQRVCDKRKENIKNGLKKIDPVTGLTKYEVSQIKARQLLKQVDSNGLSGYKKKGQKTRATHLSNIDKFGRNGYSQLATKAIIKGNKTKAKKGLITDPGFRPEFYRYKAIVTYLTEKHRNLLTSGYVTGLAGKEGAFHIDHSYSILSGYKNKISPIIIGSVHNLLMIPWQDNLSKSISCSISSIELFNKTNYTIEQSNLEFEKIMSLIRCDLENKIPVTGGNILERYYESTVSY